MFQAAARLLADGENAWQTVRDPQLRPSPESAGFMAVVRRNDIDRRLEGGDWLGYFQTA